ncbi:protein of unknown function [Methylocaldum szegediense]|uniref:Transposase n=1 Tax=Methylocaldum szegediense TaxID=73780 RepID=A0ABN8WWW2_9GAMM|nr:protein of unknown function [Methylocaldum szegediense]
MQRPQPRNGATKQPRKGGAYLNAGGVLKRLNGSFGVRDVRLHLSSWEQAGQHSHLKENRGKRRLYVRTESYRHHYRIRRARGVALDGAG